MIAAHCGAPALVPPTAAEPWGAGSQNVITPLPSPRHERKTSAPSTSAALYDTSGTRRSFVFSERCHGGASKILLGAPPLAPGNPLNGLISFHTCSAPYVPSSVRRPAGYGLPMVPPTERTNGSEAG